MPRSSLIQADCRPYPAGAITIRNLGWLIASILTAGTVNLTRLAPHIDSRAQITSVHRRLERFFTDVKLDQAEVARLVVAAVSLAARPWHLAIDRINWQFGKTDLNLL